MGTGRYLNGRFDITVVADFNMSADDWINWERAFIKGSELLYRATEGQTQFGKLFVCDDSIGINTADAILQDTAGNSWANTGGFGLPGYSIYLKEYVTDTPLSMVHEWGHHVWGLKDEYETGPFEDDIDASVPAPNNSTIPIVDTGRANDELVVPATSATLAFGGTNQTRTVIANTSTTVTVNSPYSDLPTNADTMTVAYRSDAECGEGAADNFCLMQKSRDAAGEFDATGTWVPAANPVTEFCAPSNHDPDGDTEQEWLHGKSCWETITSKAGFEALVMPDPAVSGPNAGWTDPEWIVLEKQPRFALVLDRSYSMSQGNKMEDTYYGATYWLENCAEHDDLLTIIYYNQGVAVVLDLVEVSTLGDLTTTIDDIESYAPSGSTNIRDGLYEALDQIQSPATRAAVQAALLLTDGKHNTPAGSSASEVLPDFQEAGVRIYALGVGEADKVDMDVLDDLAEDTGGTSYAVGDDNPGDIETAMVEICAEVRGGIITTQPDIMPDSDESLLKDLVEKYIGSQETPSLKEVMDKTKIKNHKELLHSDKKRPALARRISAYVEKGCERATFTLIYPKNEVLWLYLIDPDDNIVDMSSPHVRHVVSQAPHEFCIVDEPQSGLWHMLAIRPLPGPEFRFHAVAGSENRRLSVSGGARPDNQEQCVVPIWANARWKHTISGLSVIATIFDPKGGRQRIRLHDDSPDEPGNGQYEGFYKPSMTGRHKGIIKISCSGEAIIANPMCQIPRPGDKGGDFEARIKIPSFSRIIPFYFDVGKRKLVLDVEKEKGVVDKYRIKRQRPTDLKLASRK